MPESPQRSDLGGALRKRPKSGSHARVLFVDDEDLQRSSFARSMGGRGFFVDVAANAEEAVTLASQSTYPVVATDLSMPGSDGLDLIKKLHTKNPQTVFVIVTGRDELDIPVSSEFRDNVASVIAKPWDVDELANTLHRCLRLWESRSSCPPTGAPIAEGRESILLLEDNDVDADLIEAYLAFSPHRGKLVRARRLADALDRLAEEPFGVVISDLALPDARGLDAVIRIRNVAGDTPLIVMSGLEDDVVGMQAVQAGAQDFLLKGAVDAASILRSIRYAQERKRSELGLLKMANFDSLTGLANRAQFEQRLSQTLARSRRTEEPFAVLFVDLDNFKPVNDQLGHAAGDDLLVEVSRRLEGSVREYDTIARLGGDEFAVILDNLSDAVEATQSAERMLAAVSKPTRVAGTKVSITASIGIAFYPDAGETGPDLLKAADQAMYGAKRHGRNTFDLYRSRTRKSMLPMFQVCADLQQAVKRDEFCLYYQPQFDAKSRSIVGMEGLLRWMRLGRVTPPAEFLPLLEESREIARVGAWVIQRACRDLSAWQRAGFPSVDRVSVNVSVRQLEGKDLIHKVRESLHQSNLLPNQLELEVTESSVMENPNRAYETLSELKNWGVRIAMDDFGTGQSSLSYLYRLPIDTVKIDKSFVKDLADSEQCRSVTKAIIALGKQLGLETIAEGVETEAQRDFLEAEGCDVVQGFLFASPMPLADLMREHGDVPQPGATPLRNVTLLPPKKR